MDPLDRVNPAEKWMIYFYLAFKADQRQKDDYWTENQDEKFGDLLPEGTLHECTAACNVGLIVGIFSSVAETIGIATAGAALGVAGGKAAAKRIKPTSLKPCSFVEDTPVLMCDGTLKSIVDIEIGDSVLARSKLTGEIECREVMNLSEPAERSIILVTLETMDGASEVIATTENHPFFVEGLGWTRVDELVPGDLVPSATSGLLTVSALEWTDRIEVVYNFGVDEYHTYFVGEVGAWVHNCWTPGGRKLTDHAADRASERGFSMEKIDDIMDNPSNRFFQPEEGGGVSNVFVKYAGGKVEAVIEGSEGIKTVIRYNSKVDYNKAKRSHQWY